MEKSQIKFLWDEYRMAKQVSEGMWWLVTEPDPPDWFLNIELEIKK